MKNLNLEQMQKDLQTITGYSSGVKLDKLVDEFCDLNSRSTLNVAGLAKLLSLIIYENQGDKNLVKVRIKGLQVNFERKKEIIEEFRETLNEMEKEVTFQEESLGSYSIKMDKIE